MTATTFDPVAAFQAQPTLAVAAGRNLIAAGSIFGAANLFQWGVMSGGPASAPGDAVPQLAGSGRRLHHHRATPARRGR